MFMRILALEFSSPQRSVAIVTSPGRDVPHRLREKPEFEAIPVLSAASAVSVSEVVETGHTNTTKPLGMVEE